MKTMKNAWKKNRKLKLIAALYFGLAFSAELVRAEEEAASPAPQITDSCPGVLDVNRLLNAMREKYKTSPDSVRSSLYNLTFGDGDTSNPMSRIHFAGALAGRLTGEVGVWHGAKIHFENCRQVVIKGAKAGTFFDYEQRFDIVRDPEKDSRWLVLQEVFPGATADIYRHFARRVEFFAQGPDDSALIISDNSSGRAPEGSRSNLPEEIRRSIASCEGTLPSFDFNYSRILRWGKAALESEREVREEANRSAALIFNLTLQMMQRNRTPGALIDNVTGCVVTAATPKPDPTQYCSGCYREEDDAGGLIDLEGKGRQPIRYQRAN